MAKPVVFANCRSNQYLFNTMHEEDLFGENISCYRAMCYRFEDDFAVVASFSNKLDDVFIVVALEEQCADGFTIGYHGKTVEEYLDILYGAGKAPREWLKVTCRTLYEMDKQGVQFITAKEFLVSAANMIEESKEDKGTRLHLTPIK